MNQSKLPTKAIPMNTATRITSSPKRFILPLLSALASGLLMGSGQALNRQWAKGLGFFVLGLGLVGFELASGSWDQIESGYKNDYVNYFGALMAGYDGHYPGCLENYGQGLSQASGLDLGVDYWGSELVDASQLGQGLNPDQFLMAQTNKDTVHDHGLVIEASAVQYLAGQREAGQLGVLGSAETAKIQALLTIFGATSLAAINAQTGLALQAEAAPLERTAGIATLKQAKTLVRVHWRLILDGEQVGSLIEYFDPDFAKSIIGPTPLAGEHVYPLRDYGGFLTTSLDGLLSFGRLVNFDNYRGLLIQPLNPRYGWANADSSPRSLARGLLALFILLFVALAWFINIIDAWKTARRRLAGESPLKFRQLFREMSQNFYHWLVIGPVAILIILFTAIPMLYTFLLAFTDWTSRTNVTTGLVHWTGLNALSTAFNSPAISYFLPGVLLWTIIFVVLSTLSTFGGGFVLALAIDSPQVKRKNLWRAILVLPAVFPAVISLLTFKAIFDSHGLANQLLCLTTPDGQVLWNLGPSLSQFFCWIGLQEKPEQVISWYQSAGNANLAKLVVLIANFYIATPFIMLFITAILSSIPKDMIEAARIDGAGDSAIFRHIKLPLVMTALMPNLILSVTFGFQNIISIMLVTNGSPFPGIQSLPENIQGLANEFPGTSDTLASWMLKYVFIGNYNQAAIFGTIIFLATSVFTVWNLRRTKVFAEND